MCLRNKSHLRKEAGGSALTLFRRQDQKLTSSYQVVYIGTFRWTNIQKMRGGGRWGGGGRLIVRWFEAWPLHCVVLFP